MKKDDRLETAEIVNVQMFMANIDKSRLETNPKNFENQEFHTTSIAAGNQVTYACSDVSSIKIIL
jgi:hypothetical protein